MSELSDREIELLDMLSEELDEQGGSLTDWELNFAEDIVERYENYEDETYLSEKQWAVIMRILTKMELI